MLRLLFYWRIPALLQSASGVVWYLLIRGQLQRLLVSITAILTTLMAAWLRVLAPLKAASGVGWSKPWAHTMRARLPIE
jgi:hypothetical protein